MKSLDFGRYALSGCVAAAMLAGSTRPVYSATASIADRARIATAIATEIRDNGPGIFRTKGVELGPAAIERPWAIADWRSVDGNVKGQVILVYRCDQWNVRGIIAGAFNSQELAARSVPPVKVTQLLADLSELKREVAYTKIGRPGLSC